MQKQLLLLRFPSRVFARKVLCLVALVFLSTALFSQQWNMLGSESQIASVTSSYTSLAILDNVPYVVYVEGTSAGGAGKVKRRNAATDTWEQVGGDLPATITYTRIYNDRNNKLYVTYIDAANGNKLAVLTYNAGAQAWEPLITDDPYVSAGSVTYAITQFTSTPRSGLAFDSNNNPYITFSERSTGYAYVKRFVDGAWQTLGGGPVSADIAAGNNIAIDDNDVPYVVYLQQSAANSTTGALKVYRLNVADNTWGDVSPVSPVSPGSATTGATTGVRHTGIAMDSAYNPVVTYFNTSNSNKSTVIRYDKAAGVWKYIGTNGTRDAPQNSLIRDNGGNVYNTFGDILTNGGSVTYARMYKLSYGAGAFTELQNTSGTGIDNASTLNYLNAAVGSDTSRPYVVYVKANSGGVVTPVVQVFGQSVSTAPVTGITATSATTGGNIQPDGSVITERGVVYSTYSNPTVADTKVIDPSGGTGSFTSALSGLSVATSYHVRAYTISSTGKITYGNDVQFSTNPPDAGSVTVVDNGATVTMKNAKVAITITKATAAITSIMYNGKNLLQGGYNGGQLYWSWNMPGYQNPSGCTYTLTADPHNNNFDYGEIKLSMKADSAASTAALDMDIYYSLTRDASGIYASATLKHPATYGHANPGGEFRMAGYPGSTFNWLSVDSLRNKLMADNNDWGTPVALSTAPPENMLLTTGIRAHTYECKYDYSADFGDQDAWGWSSTTDNVGLWMTAPSKEYYNGGPMKRELMCHGSPTILNMLNGQHYGMGEDGGIQANEDWEKTFGPFLIYCNSVPAGTAGAPAALWKDAVAQAKKEQAAWPYSWYTNASYVQESGRGAITGTLAVIDPDATSTSAANIWVGVAAQPANDPSADFQHWSKNYQFWVKTDANGNFTIPHVLPGTYNFYAFGPGVAGQLTLNNYVTVTAGNTNALGTVNWTPARTAATVWEIGTPDRSAKEFYHGNDWFVSDNTVNADSTNWAKFRDYTAEFPDDVNFTIGKSKAATDWNYVMPFDKGYNQTTSPVWTINFNLAAAPAAGSTVSLYVALAANFSAALITSVNGVNITSPSTGAVFGSKSDAMIRMGIHGAFTDVRFNFPAGSLHAGANTISFTERLTGGATSGDLMFDYIRLEADGASLALPVKTLSLSGQAAGSSNILTWKTASEVNTSAFHILRGHNAALRDVIATVPAAGNSDGDAFYEYKDEHPLSGSGYYQIQLVDKDGKSEYSNIVQIGSSGNDQVSIYPNPVHDKLFIQTSLSAGLGLIKMYDIKGVLRKREQVSGAQASVDISSVPAGIYIVEVQAGAAVVKKMIIKK